MTEQLYSEDTPDPKKSPLKGTAKELTVLDRLRETITKKIERPVVRLAVPERPGVSLRISPNITQQQMRSWRRNSGEDTKAGMNATKFAAYVVGHTTVGILFNEEEVYDEAGNVLNFASDVILDMTDSVRPVPDAVADKSPSGYSNTSPFSSFLVRNPSGTSTFCPQGVRYSINGSWL